MSNKIDYDRQCLDKLKKLILEEKKDLNSDEVINLAKDLEKSFVEEMKLLNTSTSKKEKGDKK